MVVRDNTYMYTVWSSLYCRDWSNRSTIATQVGGCHGCLKVAWRELPAGAGGGWRWRRPWRRPPRMGGLARFGRILEKNSDRLEVVEVEGGRALRDWCRVVGVVRLIEGERSVPCKKRVSRVDLPRSSWLQQISVSFHHFASRRPASDSSSVKRGGSSLCGSSSSTSNSR